MAMIRPIGQQVNAFDATQKHSFYFTSIGGNQVVKNRLTIRNNNTNTIVYEKTVETFSFEHIVPANTLINGTYYNYYFNTYDIEENESESSIPIPFWCFTNPKIEITNIPENNIIVSSVYKFNATYSQNENELIDFINYNLYDGFNNLLFKSENIYSTLVPPINFTYTIQGLENNKNYKIEVTGVTINGTKFTTEKLGFVVSYRNPQVYSILGLENKCDEGYIQISSKLVTIDGISNPDPPIYIENNMINLLKKGHYVKWEQGFRISQQFIFRLWFKTNMLGQIAVLKKDDNNKFIINFVREVPFGEVKQKDYVEIIGYENSIEKFYMRSNYIPITNNTTDLMLWFKYDLPTSKYELILTNLYEEDNILNWNYEDNNVQYNRLSNILWQNENDSIGEYKPNMFEDTTQMFPLTSVKLFNGIYDFIDITSNTLLSFKTEQVDWTYDTILNCDFNNNINGGNTDILLSQVYKLKIKRRELGTFEWITLYDIPISVVEELNVIKTDFIVPHGITQEYALVPILFGDIDGDYITNTITPSWRYVFVSDRENSFKLYSNVTYGNTTSVMDIGWHKPIGSKYPVSVQNGKIDYEEGSISGNILGENYLKTKDIDRNEVVDTISRWYTFLKNGKTKVIKDWNGNIKIARIASSPSNSFIQPYGNGFGMISFTWYEQGKYNNKKDLFENGLTDIYE